MKASYVSAYLALPQCPGCAIDLLPNIVDTLRAVFILNNFHWEVDLLIKIVPAIKWIILRNIFFDLFP